MNIAKTQSLIGKFLFLAILIATGILCYGLISYLISHPHDSVNFSSFHAMQKQDVFVYHMIKDAFQNDAKSLMMLGLWLVFFSQILRVVLTGYIFVIERNTWFIVFTLLILLTLIYAWI